MGRKCWITTCAVGMKGAWMMQTWSATRWGAGHSCAISTIEEQVTGWCVGCLLTELGHNREFSTLAGGAQEIDIWKRRRWMSQAIRVSRMEAVCPGWRQTKMRACQEVGDVCGREDVCHIQAKESGCPVFAGLLLHLLLRRATRPYANTSVLTARGRIRWNTSTRRKLGRRRCLDLAYRRPIPGSASCKAVTKWPRTRLAAVQILAAATAGTKHNNTTDQ